MFETYPEGGLISKCKQYRIIKGYNNLWEIYEFDQGDFYLIGERKLITKAIKFASDSKKLNKFLKNEL